MTFVHSNPGPGKHENNEKKGFSERNCRNTKYMFFYSLFLDINLEKTVRYLKKKSGSTQIVILYYEILWQIECR